MSAADRVRKALDKAARDQGGTERAPYRKHNPEVHGPAQDVEPSHDEEFGRHMMGRTPGEKHVWIMWDDEDGEYSGLPS